MFSLISSFVGGGVVVIYNQKPTHIFYVHSVSLRSLMYTHSCMNHRLANMFHHFDMDDFDKDLDLSKQYKK